MPEVKCEPQKLPDLFSLRSKCSCSSFFVSWMRERGESKNIKGADWGGVTRSGKGPRSKRNAGYATTNKRPPTTHPFQTNCCGGEEYRLSFVSCLSVHILTAYEISCWNMPIWAQNSFSTKLHDFPNTEFC